MERIEVIREEAIKLAGNVKFKTGIIVPEADLMTIVEGADKLLDKTADLNNKEAIIQALTDASINLMKEDLTMVDKKADKQGTAVLDGLMNSYFTTSNVDKTAAAQNFANAVALNPVQVMLEMGIKLANLEAEKADDRSKLVKLAESVEQLTAAIAESASTTGTDIVPEGTAAKETTQAEAEALIAGSKPVLSVLTGAGDTTITNPDMAGTGGVSPNPKPVLADTIAAAKKAADVVNKYLGEKKK